MKQFKIQTLINHALAPLFDTALIKTEHVQIYKAVSLN